MTPPAHPQDAWATRILADRLEALQGELPAVAHGGDREALRRARVASRRLRVALRLLAPALPGKKVQAWSRHLARLGRVLGEARDLDVQIETLHTWLEAQPLDLLREGPARLAMRLSFARMRHQKDVRRALERFQAGGLALPTHLSPTPLDLRTPLLGHLEAALALGNAVRAQAPSEALHMLRIELKRLRYALEATAPFLHAEAETCLQTLRGLQDALGGFHDAEVWIARLPRPLRKAQKRGKLRRALGLLAFLHTQQARRQAHLDELATRWLAAQTIWPRLRAVILAMDEA